MIYFLVAIASLALLVSSAWAYESPQGIEPVYVPGSTNLSAQGQNSWEYEYKSAQKDAIAGSGFDVAIAKGGALYYDTNYLGGAYTVTPYGGGTGKFAGNDQVSANMIACIAGRIVATGDSTFFPCITRGYVDQASYDGTGGIVIGGSLCIGTQASTVGNLIPCASGVVSPIKALKAVSSGTGNAAANTGLPVIIESR